MLCHGDQLAHIRVIFDEFELCSRRMCCSSSWFAVISLCARVREPSFRRECFKEKAGYVGRGHLEEIVRGHQSGNKLIITVRHLEPWFDSRLDCIVE